MSVCERYCYWLHSVDSEFYLCAVLPEQMCCERYCYWLHSVDSEFYLCAVLPEQMCCTISGPPSFPACIAWPTLPLKVNPASMHHLMHAATPLAIYTCQRQSIVNIAIYKHVTDYSVFFSSFFFCSKILLKENILANCIQDILNRLSYLNITLHRQLFVYPTGYRWRSQCRSTMCRAWWMLSGSE